MSGDRDVQSGTPYSISGGETWLLLVLIAQCESASFAPQQTDTAQTTLQTPSPRFDWCRPTATLLLSERTSNSDVVTTALDAGDRFEITVPMKEDRISIYAELLSNIRQVSIAASLPSPPGPRTVAKVFDGGRRLCIEHDGQTEALDLPGTVFGNTTLQVSQSASRELTWRLPLSSEGTPFPHFSPETQAVPWVASDLDHGSAIYCRSCNSIVIPKDTIQSWKDLPSENWAEMMEFWHCHKPHDHSEHQQESLADRGYGANSVITAQPGTGFVDITSFMFDETNCQNLLVSSAA